MCNLSRGVMEKGIKIGEIEMAKKITVELLKMQMPIDDIVEVTELTREQVLEIAKENSIDVIKQ